MSEGEEKQSLRFFVRIPNWHPTRLNELISCHWATRNRLKKHDANIIGISVLGADVPKAATKRRVSLVITLRPRQRAGDPDAYLKSALDGLVKCGALVNDSHVWCQLGGVTFERGTASATVIILENLDTKTGVGPVRSGEAAARIRDGKRRHRVELA